MKVIIPSILGSVFLFTGAVSAFETAQSSPPPLRKECSKMRDKQGCTCALQTGGNLDRRGGWEYTNTARYTECMVTFGRIPRS